MFKGRIVSRSNINGKVHTFQKDFDDYDSYQDFVSSHPEYSSRSFLSDFWNPFISWDKTFPHLLSQKEALSVNTKHLPEGVDLSKYEQRRQEKRLSEIEKQERKQHLEKGKEFLVDYLKENPDDTDAKGDLEKLENELSKLH